MSSKNEENNLVERSSALPEPTILPVMADQTPINGRLSPSLWEHWLQRLYLTSRVVPSVERARLELLDRLTYLQAHDRRFWIRKANRFKEAFDTPLVIVTELTNKKMNSVYSTVSQKAQLETLKVLKKRQLLNIRPGLVIYRQKWSLRLGERTATFTSMALLTVASADGSLTTIIIATPEPVSRNDSKFLQLCLRLIRSQQRQQQLNAALNSETERLATLTHHLSEGLMIVDKKLRIVLWNRPLQRLTGYAPNEAEGRSAEQVFSVLANPRWLSELMAEYQPTPLRNVFSTDLEIKTKQRRSCWVNVSGSFLRDSDGAIEQVIVIVRDISRHKELEARKNEFISIATHELRTPITAIKGYLSLLENYSDRMSEKQHLYLSRAVQANDRLVRLAEDLLQVIHVEENRLRFSLRPISLLPIARKVVTDFRARAKKKGLTLTLATPDFPTAVAADPVRIEQVLANLVDNGLKYSQEGGVELLFSQAEDKVTQERRVVIQIKDKGIGIPEKDLPFIFDKFHRCTNGSRTEPGTGLGLFIVKSFVEKQGGNITVRSKMRRGSVFTLSFPAVEPRALERREHGQRSSLAR